MLPPYVIWYNTEYNFLQFEFILLRQIYRKQGMFFSFFSDARVGFCLFFRLSLQMMHSAMQRVQRLMPFSRLTALALPLWLRWSWRSSWLLSSAWALWTEEPKVNLLLSALDSLWRQISWLGRKRTAHTISCSWLFKTKV